MSKQFIEASVTILLGIIGVAVIAVLVSSQAKTSAVIGAASGGFASDLLCALSPVIGGSCGGGRSLIPQVDSSVTFPTLGRGGVLQP
jgi:PRD1 phage membrane DNA delivery